MGSDEYIYRVREIRERYTKKIESVIDKAGVEKDNNDVYEDLECFYYDSWSKNIYKRKCIRLQTGSDRVPDMMQCLESNGDVRGACVNEIIALVHNGKIIYQNDNVILKNREKIQSKENECHWNKKFLRAMDYVTGKLNISAVYSDKGETQSLKLYFLPSAVELDLYDKRQGIYSVIHIPEGTMINGEDCSNLCIYTKDKIDRQNLTKVFNVIFKPDFDIKLANDGQVVKTVKAKDLQKGLVDLYRTWKMEREAKQAQEVEMGK